MDYEHKCFKKKKYKYNMANKHVRECLTFLENKKEKHIKMGILFAIKLFQG